jgi:AcrR family transcriptional regulator
VTTPRRERLRLATITEIKQAALDQIADGGTGSLSIRGIARAIGMSPAGLYRYYDSLDGLLTELITDAYSDLADTVEKAVVGPGTVRERLVAGMLAYRRWSVDHSNQFLLIFGTPIPGYAAPEQGPTVQANRRIGTAFFGLVVEGWQTGALDLAAPPRPPTVAEAELLAEAAPGFPASWLPPFVGAWAHFHGMVTLEILGQLDWIYPDGADFYRAEVERLIDSWVVDG